VHANESLLELLAGVEAGIDTQTAMTEEDLVKTQESLSKSKSGVVTSWYNTKTTTQFVVKIGSLYSDNFRPCIAYQLVTKYNSQAQEKQLNACMNYDGNWIAIMDINTL
jgi:surface antigen